MTNTQTPQTPDLSFYFGVHDHMRRDLARYLDTVSAAVESERPTRLKALRRWTQGFIHELEEHHFVEDTIFFPEMRARIPSVAAIIDGLEGDHRRLDELLERWPAVSDNLASPNAAFGPAKSAAVALATELCDLLSTHLDIEDNDVLPLYWRHYTAAEYDELQADAVKNGKKTGLWFVAPWNVDNLEGAEQAAFLAAAPVPLRILHRMVRPSYDRLVAAAYGPASPPR